MIIHKNAIDEIGDKDEIIRGHPNSVHAPSGLLKIVQKIAQGNGRAFEKRADRKQVLKNTIKIRAHCLNHHLLPGKEIFR